MKYIVLLSLLFSAGCTTVQKEKIKETSVTCLNGGVLVNDENPEEINCSEINLFSNETKELSWEENTKIKTILDKKGLKIKLIYSNDGRYYLYANGEIVYKETKASLKLLGQKPESLGFAFKDNILSTRGRSRYSKIRAELTIKIVSKKGKEYNKVFKIIL